VVAHRHHYDRCRLLIEKVHIGAIRSPDLYEGYDPFEAQPRAMTPEDNIINDFASMVGMAHAAKPSAVPSLLPQHPRRTRRARSE
jgi:hypothetical protein